MKRLYRARNGQIFGVCRGLADYTDIPVEFIRISAVLALIFTGFFPVGLIYIVAGFFLPLEASHRRKHDRDRWHEQDDFSFGFCRRPKDAFKDMKKDFDNLKKRMSGMERSFYDKEREWDEKFRQETV